MPSPPGSLLNLDASRPHVEPADAATLVLLRDGDQGLEVFCVERNRKSRFMGGALVFPGGKVDAGDRDPEWNPLRLEPHARLIEAGGADYVRPELAIAACRESLEEAAILPVSGTLTHDEALRLRQALVSGPGALRAALVERGLRIDLASLVPFARWVTPAAEARRFDTRFFMARTPAGQDGAHDDHETMASFWATPNAVLERWEARAVQMAPPTHHTLVRLSRSHTVDEALREIETARLDPICPLLVDQDGAMALTLPGDPEHPQDERLIDGRTRYVLREEQWRPEDPPTNLK
jgi:8-oxo-dGTP pyrophosphatase MutT (NUDIX family)